MVIIVKSLKKKQIDMDDFWQKFRNQCSDNEWAQLIQDFRFKKALLNLDQENIPTLADEILIGKARTAEEARQLRDYYERYGKHHDYITPRKTRPYYFRRLPQYYDGHQKS